MGGRAQSPGEEIANSISHGIGLVAAISGLPFLIMATVRRGNWPAIISASVFASTVFLLYITSTLYHALPNNRAKRIFQILDHGAIFLLIAGTYTPFTIGPLRGAWGWTLFGLVWALAVFGVVLKVLRGVRHPKLSLFLYLGMGWIALIAIRPLWLNMPLAGLLWIAAGGLAYTGGVAFYAFERMRYAHLIWHVFVVVGTACHFVAVMNFAS